ncbi:MAG TPA: hypothetical protein VIM42_09200 [Clostridium sp.]
MMCECKGCKQFPLGCESPDCLTLNDNLHCKKCKSKELFDTEEDGKFITICNDCGAIQ